MREDIYSAQEPIRQPLEGESSDLLHPVVPPSPICRKSLYTTFVQIIPSFVPVYERERVNKCVLCVLCARECCVYASVRKSERERERELCVCVCLMWCVFVQREKENYFV